jgi:hypothetical protein
MAATLVLTHRLAEVVRVADTDPLASVILRYRARLGKELPIEERRRETYEAMQNPYGLTGGSCKTPGGGLSW